MKKVTAPAPPAVATPAPSPFPEPKKPEHDEYQVKSAMDDLMRAEEHKQNPKLMAAIQKHVKKKKKAINSIAGLKKVRAQMSAAKGGIEPDDEESEMEE